jgi:ABC-type Mn2+/Zn2+ transport system permease subunit
MIESFVASWPLFHQTYVAGWLIAALLALVGVVVVARDQIFLGAAVSQASTLGIAIGMYLASLSPDAELVERDPWILSLAAVAFAIAAALSSSAARRASGDTYESITGWVFLASSSLSILVVAQSPHGLEEVHRLLSSSLIGATDADVTLFALLLVPAVAAIVATRRELLLYAMDPGMAEAVGLRVTRWSLVVLTALGVVVALSIRVSGTLYAFGCLVLPALAAKSLSREALPLFWIAPALATFTAMWGFIFANHLDLPPAPVTVGLLAAIAALSRLIRP